MPLLSQQAGLQRCSIVKFYFGAFEDGPKTLGRDAWLLPEQAQAGLDAVVSMPAQLVV